MCPPCYNIEPEDQHEDLYAALRSNLSDIPHHEEWIRWFESNMPLSYFKHARQDPNLHRVHVKAIANFCEPGTDHTTTVVRNRTNFGFAISVFDTQNCPGTLLHNLKHTLPQTETAAVGIDVFCSLDDTVALSIYRHCEDTRRLERPNETEVQKFILFAQEVQLGKLNPNFHPESDFSCEFLRAWIMKCSAYFIKCTCIEVIYRMYLFDSLAHKTGRVMVDWMPEADDPYSGVPPSRSSDYLNSEHCPKKQQQLAHAFWIYGCVMSVPNLKVAETACRVFLAQKLNIERAHTDTKWDEDGTPTVFLRFLVLPPEGQGLGTAPLAAKAATALRDALFEAQPQRGAKGWTNVARPVDTSFGSESSFGSNAEISSEEHEPRSAPLTNERCGYLQKQRRCGLLRYWQHRWVEIRGDTLLFSKTKEARTQKLLYLSKLTCHPDPHRHGLCLADGAGRAVLRLRCGSGQEQAAWKTAILDAQMSNLTPEKPEISGSDSSNRSDDDLPVVSTNPGVCVNKDLRWEGVCPVRYERIACLDRGPTSKVWKVRDRESGSVFAVKIVSKTSSDDIELETLQTLAHPFIVKLHYSFQTSSKLCLIMDYCAGGTLGQLLTMWSSIPESAARFYATEIALALKYIHSMDIIHRDVKPGNVMMSRTGHVVLVDFGIATRKTEAHTFCGTPHYVAPEVLRHQAYTKAVDWWSYGVMLHQMLSGILPFNTQGDGNGTTLYHRIVHGSPDFARVLTPPALSLLQGLVEQNPARRYGFEEVSRHPFFASVDWDASLQIRLPCPFIPDN